MGQQEVYDCLKKKKGWMTSTEIAEAIGINRGSVTTSLAKLRWSKHIKSKIKDKSKREYVHRILKEGEDPTSDIYR